jgi:hypothetical protein
VAERLLDFNGHGERTCANKSRLFKDCCSYDHDPFSRIPAHYLHGAIGESFPALTRGTVPRVLSHQRSSRPRGPDCARGVRANAPSSTGAEDGQNGVFEPW